MQPATAHLSPPVNESANQRTQPILPKPACLSIRLLTGLRSGQLYPAPSIRLFAITQIHLPDFCVPTNDIQK